MRWKLSNITTACTELWVADGHNSKTEVQLHVANNHDVYKCNVKAGINELE